MAALTEAAYIENLRAFIKDYDTRNRLLAFTMENDDTFLKLYLQMALGFLSTMPPNVGTYSYGTFPMPSLLLHQATIECLISNNIAQARNDLTYNNGGVTLKIDDGQRYLQLIELLYRMTNQELSNFKQIKIAANIEGGWGGSHSPYGYLHGRSQSLQPNSLLDG